MATITRLQGRLIDIWPGRKSDLASATGINAGTLSNYLHGHTVIPPHHLLLLAQALSCAPSDLLGTTTLAELPTVR